MSETRREVVVVTGAPGGVGRAAAHAFARRGAAAGALATALAVAPGNGAPRRP